MDELLAAWVDRIIRRTRDEQEGRVRFRIDPQGKLRLLFAGYNGTRNTGADVRVEEMLRQVRHLFGEDRVKLTVFSFIKEYSRGYFGDARQISPGVLFPEFLRREIPRHDGVIACEGSAFKSAFTDLLTVMMVGAMGMAAAQKKLSIAYGAEAGYMNPWPRKLAAEHCKNSFVITRNKESQSVLSELGIRSECGTDTAWTFSPLGPEYAEQELRKVGWRGERILMVCPINPFCWPVKASLSKAFCRLFGFYRDSHYGRIFFFNDGVDRRQSFENYLTAISQAVDRYRRRTGTFVVVGASEELDNRAANLLAKKLNGAPVFSSSQHNMYQLVSLFRKADLMLSSRYHAIVTSMAAGVASAGISFDERIVNLMRERQHQELLIQVDDPDLAEKAELVLDDLDRRSDQIAVSVRQTVARQLRIMSSMGRMLVNHVSEARPEFAPSRRFDSWEDYLPPLGPELHQLLDVHLQSA